MARYRKLIKRLVSDEKNHYIFCIIKILSIHFGINRFQLKLLHTLNVGHLSFFLRYSVIPFGDQAEKRMDSRETTHFKRTLLLIKLFFSHSDKNRCVGGGRKVQMV